MQVTRATYLPLLAPADPQRMGDGAVWDEYSGDLAVAYTFGPPFGKRVVTHADLDQMQLSHRVMRRTALEHLESLASRAQFHGQAPALMLSFEGLESSLLLANEPWLRLQQSFPGELVVGVPARDVVIVTGSQSLPGLEKARRAVDRVFFAGDDHLLTRKLLVRRGGIWEPFDRQTRPSGRPTSLHRPAHRPPRQNQEHPSLPGERVPVAAVSPSPVDRVPPERRPAPATGPVRRTPPIVPAAATRVGPPANAGPMGPSIGPAAPIGPGAPPAPSSPVPAPRPPTRAVPMRAPGVVPGHADDYRPRYASPMIPEQRVAEVAQHSAIPVSAVPSSALPYSAVPRSPMGWSRGAQAAAAKAGYGQPLPAYDATDTGVGPGPASPAFDTAMPRRPLHPEYTAPVSSVPRQLVSPYLPTAAGQRHTQVYSAPPAQYSRPYSAPPASRPYSAPPAYVTPYSAPPAYVTQYGQAGYHEPIYPASWGPESPSSRPAWDGRTGARSRFSR